MKPHERIVRVRLDHPAVEHVQRTRNEKQTITEIPKSFHNNTKIAKPKAVATSSFKTKIMLTTLTYPQTLSRNFSNNARATLYPA